MSLEKELTKKINHEIIRDKITGSGKSENKTQKKQGSKTQKKQGSKTQKKQGSKTQKKQGSKTQKKQGSKIQKKQENKTQKKQENKTQKKQGSKTQKKQENKTQKKQGSKTQKKQGSKTQIGKGVKKRKTPEHIQIYNDLKTFVNNKDSRFVKDPALTKVISTIYKGNDKNITKTKEILNNEITENTLYDKYIKTKNDMKLKLKEKRENN